MQQTRTSTPTASASTLWQLGSFCRGEMAAAEAYTTAMLHELLVPFYTLLRVCRASHSKRARLLQQRIAQLGGTPPETSGAWGAVVDVIEEAAADISANAAIRALAEGENHGLRNYHAGMSSLDPGTQSFVRRELLPGQLETRRNIEALRRSLS